MKKFLFTLLALLAIATPVRAEAPALVHRVIAANNNNCTLVRAGYGTIKSIVVCGGTTTVHYVKIYDKATAPSASDTPIMVLSSGISTAPATCSTVELGPAGLQYVLGLGYCIVQGVADNDNTSASTSGALVTIGYR